MVACMKPLPLSGSTLFVTIFPLTSNSVDSLSDQSENNRPENVFKVLSAVNQSELSGKLVALDDVAEIELPPVRAYVTVARCCLLIAQSSFENKFRSDSSRLRDGTPASK